MTLEDIKRELESSQLSEDELRDLREHIERMERRQQAKTLLAAFNELGGGLTEEQLQEMEQAIHTRITDESPEERIRQLDGAFAEIREGMTQAELDAMFEAMNSEYVEPLDEDEWKD